MFAALVRASIWSRNVIVRYNLFGYFAYSNTERAFFAIFGQIILAAEHSINP